ncbi:acyl-CoA desaturase 1-like [Chelonus insularis]|uniref:acyl-CoA desaturase 1-like n=1 Tax=Chelonus insularis TaxID=460826 RepID=UPI00158EB095|nr:acyl-CoA desaturase 1-like [Chelonus insularis]
MPPNCNDTKHLERWNSYYQSKQYAQDLEDEYDNSKNYHELSNKIIWPKLLLMIVFNVVSIYTAITFPYSEQIFLLLWAYVIAYLSILGVTAGAHRLWAHRTYEADTSLRIFLAICYYLSGFQKIFTWVRNHRAHHQYLQCEGDPYNNRRGFWFSHVGWLVMKENPETQKLKAKVDMRDVGDDTVIQFFDGNFYLNTILFSIILPIFIPVYFFNQDLEWAIVSQLFIRYPFVLHSIWSINSLASTIGTYSYNRNILPADNKLVSFLTLGEGWQNFHHVFPSDYRSTDINGHFNPTASWINLFAFVGLAHNLYTVPHDQVRKEVEYLGNGSHPTIKTLHYNRKSQSFFKVTSSK